MARSCSLAVKPSAAKSCGAPSPNACSRIPATRTIKNSSRFELKIARNFMRSSSGLSSFSASSRTLRLNSSQLSSRLMNASGPIFFVDSSATVTILSSDSDSALLHKLNCQQRSTQQPDYKVFHTHPNSFIFQTPVWLKTPSKCQKYLPIRHFWKRLWQSVGNYCLGLPA